MSDVYCYLDVEVDPKKYVKPIETKAVPTKSTTDDIGVGAFKTVTKFSFYESGKWVKVLLDFPDIKVVPKENVTSEFNKRSFSVKVLDYKGANYQFTVPKTHCPILPEASYVSFKTNNIQINLRKAKDDDNWWSLFKQKAVGEVDSD
jgi:hypothetical protein